MPNILGKNNKKPNVISISTTLAVNILLDNFSLWSFLYLLCGTFS